MINTLFSGFLKLLVMFIDFLLTPIDNFIFSYLPDLSYAFDLIVQFFDYCNDLMKWVISWFNVPTGFVTFLIAFTVFRLTVPYLVHNLKLILAWWDTIVS